MAVRTLQEIVEEFIGTLIRDNNVLKNEVKDIASNTLSELKTMNINTARMNVTEREMIISTIKNEIGKRLADMYKGNKSVVTAIKNINKSLKIKQTPSVVVRDDTGKFVSAKDPTAQKIIVKDEAGNTNITDKSEGDVFKEMLDKIINKKFEIPNTQNNLSGYFNDLRDMRKEKENDAYYADESNKPEKQSEGMKGFHDKLFDKIDEVIEILSYGNAIEGAQTGMLASMTGFLGLNKLAAWFSGFFGFKALGGKVKGLGKFIAMIPLAIGKWLTGIISTSVGGLVARMAGVPFIAAIMAKVKGPFAVMAAKTSGVWGKVAGGWFGTAVGGFFKTLGGLFGKIFFPIAIIQAGIETLFASESEIERVTGEGGRVQYFFTKIISSIVGIVDIFTGALSWLTGFDLSTDLSGKVESMIKGVVDWFRDGGLAKIWGWLKDVFSAIAKPFIEVGVILMPLFDILKEDIKTLWKVVKFIGGIGWEIAKGIGWAIGWLGENILLPVIGFVWDKFKLLLKGVVWIIVKLVELRNFILSGFVWVGEKVIDFVNWFKGFSFMDWIGGLWTGFKEWVGGLWDSAVNWSNELDMFILQKALDLKKWYAEFSFTDWIGDLWVGLKDFVSNMWTEIMDELKMLWTNLKELGHKYTLGLPGTIMDLVTGKDDKVAVEKKPLTGKSQANKVPEPTSGLWDNIKSLGNFLVEASPKKEKDTEYRRFFERENNNTENIVEMKKAKDPTVEGVHNFTSNNKSVMVNNTYNVSNSTENTSVSGAGGGGSFVISATPDGKNAAAMGEA